MTKELESTGKKLKEINEIMLNRVTFYFLK